MRCVGTQVSRESPPLTAKQLAAQLKENGRQDKERAREACQQQLAAAIEAGELEVLREAIDAADLAGCYAPLLKRARGRRDALRKAARRLERQAAATQDEEEARQQQEWRAAEAAAEEDTVPSLPAAMTSLADAQFDTGRPGAPESTIGGQMTCIVCFINPKSHAAVPCGHQCACGDCSAQMKECPICRNPAHMWMHVRVT